MRFQAVIAAVAFMPSPTSAAPTPIHLVPSSPWVVDYAENSCRLARRFGEGKDMTTFALESEAPGSLDMLIVGRPLRTISERLPVRFIPLQSKRMDGRVTETAVERIPSVLIDDVRMLPDEAIAIAERMRAEQIAHPDLRPPGMSLAEQAQWKAQREKFATETIGVEVDASHDHPVVLDTGSMGDAIKAFDRCGRDSLRDWGVDPDVDDKIVRPVWAQSPATWFSPKDYPRDMLVMGEESVVKIRVLVDATGRVTKCTSVSHFRAPEFNKITCDKFTQRVHFDPAELADGTKVPSYYVNRVIFRIAR